MNHDFTLLFGASTSQTWNAVQKPYLFCSVPEITVVLKLETKGTRDFLPLQDVVARGRSVKIIARARHGYKLKNYLQMPDERTKFRFSYRQVLWPRSFQVCDASRNGGFLKLKSNDVIVSCSIFVWVIGQFTNRHPDRHLGLVPIKKFIGRSLIYKFCTLHFKNRVFSHNPLLFCWYVYFNTHICRHKQDIISINRISINYHKQIK